MNKIVAVVGMPGSGKSEVVKIFEEYGFFKIYFGGAVIEELKKKGMEINEANESKMRQDLRKEHGMAAMAKLSLLKINETIGRGNVVIDGLYSMEEYETLKEKFPQMTVLCVYSPPSTRYERLANRPIRPLTQEESRSRDFGQIKNLHTGGPIAMADYTMTNEDSLKDLQKKTKAFIKIITTK